MTDLQSLANKLAGQPCPRCHGEGAVNTGAASNLFQTYECPACREHSGYRFSGRVRIPCPRMIADSTLVQTKHSESCVCQGRLWVGSLKLDVWLEEARRRGFVSLEYDPDAEGWQCALGCLDPQERYSIHWTPLEVLLKVLKA